MQHSNAGLSFRSHMHIRTLSSGRSHIAGYAISWPGETVRKTLVETLQQAIRRKYRCVAVHFRTVPVTVEFRGKNIWDGEVEEFHLRACPHAEKCYAWMNG